MDSMRSLNTSLPTSSPRKRPDPPEHLLQAFRSAALSVTTLYKTAAADQASANQAGYQEALDDLLVFLDRENLGLGDGEGWRVRQWATERLDGAQGSGESEDEKPDVESRARSASPTITRKETLSEHESGRLATRSASPSRVGSIRQTPPSSQAQAPQQPPSNSAPADTFTFRSSVPYPHQRDMEMQGVDSDGPSPALAQRSSHVPAAERHGSASSHKHESSARGSRHRHGGNASRPNNRSATSMGLLGSGAGTKRRLAFGDFFDIGPTGNGKEGFGGGGKRGRLQ